MAYNTPPWTGAQTHHATAGPVIRHHAVHTIGLQNSDKTLGLQPRARIRGASHTFTGCFSSNGHAVPGVGTQTGRPALSTATSIHLLVGAAGTVV